MSWVCCIGCVNGKNGFDTILLTKSYSGTEVFIGMCGFIQTEISVVDGGPVCQEKGKLLSVSL